MLKLIGYWQEPFVFEDEPAWPHPSIFVTSWPKQFDKAKTISYLQSGNIAMSYKGISQCRFCKKINGSCEMTDGVWAWPDGLAHYVEEHGVVPPTDFLTNAKENRYIIEKKDCHVRPRDLNLDYWKNFVSQPTPMVIKILPYDKTSPNY